MKYRNPENAAQNWSGRNNRPAWFVEALKNQGMTADSLLIAGPADKNVSQGASWGVQHRPAP
ncbi:H-NS family nucleoid-associated regulatory protein [Dyella sp. A6]|uniref:H-NS family nucleoid-associated regulatory protein n=1 Tax=Dyella aluminiiresistens TaxID=3069105 RepID=UPI002E76BD6D|nr:H-NS family nucleoid-associated regulatory protein [Dyella sp. A6]